jgi:drug/metabolite transporter (DMT)-like permease
VLALPLLHERLNVRQWAGIGVGVLGVALIVSPKLGSVEGIALHALAVGLLATLSLTLGTIWQKRSRPSMDLRVNAAIQFVGAFVLTAPFALALEAGRFDHSVALYGALAWAVLGLSVGGISIMLYLLRRGAASKVAPLLYLSPPVAGLMALALFGESLSIVQVAGMVLAVVGAFAARR